MVGRARLTMLQRLPPQDVGRGPTQVAIDANGTPLLWSAERVDRGYYLDGVYRFLRFVGESVEKLPIPPLAGLHPRLYPFVDGRLLALFTRTSRGELRDNAFVFGNDGKLLESFRTADAVADAQISATGDIWVSYFDESDEGQLDCFDDRGQRLFTYHPLWEEHDLPPLVDSYALNVSSDTETWVYYYSDFPLVHLVDRRLAGHWDASTVPGAHAVAVDGHRALCAGRYNRPNGLFLFDLQTGSVEELQAAYESGRDVSLEGSRWLGRGPRLYIGDSFHLYTIDMADLR